MKQHSAIVILMSVLAGCGGGGGGGNQETPRNNDSNPLPPSTPVGSVLGAAVSAVIGSDGGELQSADGSVTLLVPAGAFSADTTVSIQPISNEALGGIGNAFRIRPEGLHSNLPMTLRFKPGADDLQGSALRFINIGFQDSAGHWRVYEQPQRDSASNTVSVQTTHFSDWSMLAGVQLRPGKATVKTAATQLLTIQYCESDEYPVDDPDYGQLPVLLECHAAPNTALSAQHWSVNGAEGGSAVTGTVVANADKDTGEAFYSAPYNVPDVNPVAVSVEVHDPENPGDKTLLVSNITLVPDTSCDALKRIEFIEAGVAFAPFNWTASNDNQAYEGHQSGRLGGTMTNQIPPAARDLSPIGFWTSQNTTHSGLVAMNDTHTLFYPDETVIQQAVGSGLPYNGMDVPSFISLTVDYATCEYELVASFTVMGTVSENGVSAETPIAPGGIYYRESVPEELLLNGNLTRELTLPVHYDPNDKHNGYYPAGQNDQLRAQGSTELNWTLELTR